MRDAALLLSVISEADERDPLTSQPAISVPCGTTRARLPIGLQIVRRPFEDGLVLAAADAVENQLGPLRLPG